MTLVCVLIGVFYVVTLFYPQWLNTFGMQVTEANVQFWTIAIPVLVAFIGILGIGSWIGWTMATTPPPKPIEELQTETEQKSANKETV
jgi:predicted DNA-binding transcriptional regulator